MPTGTVRIILVVGGVVLAQAFPTVEAGVAGEEAGGGNGTVPTDGGTGETPAGDAQGGGGGPQGNAGGAPTRDASIIVLNGTDVTGLAERTATLVQDLGYTNVDFGDAETDSDETVIFYQPEYREVALDIRQGLGLGQAPMSRATGEDDVAHVTVLLGADYGEANG